MLRGAPRGAGTGSDFLGPVVPRSSSVLRSVPSASLSVGFPNDHSSFPTQTLALLHAAFGTRRASERRHVGKGLPIWAASSLASSLAEAPRLCLIWTPHPGSLLRYSKREFWLQPPENENWRRFLPHWLPLAPRLMGCLAFSAAFILFWGREAAKKQRNKEAETPLNSFHPILIC